MVVSTRKDALVRIDTENGVVLVVVVVVAVRFVNVNLFDR